MRLPGACHVHFVRSAVAHARIAAIDISAALEAPGVIAVFTGADLAELPPMAPPMPGMINAQMGQPLLARDVVRYVGEPVAVVVTEGRYQGEDAGDLVDVDYEVLTPVIDMTTAASPRGSRTRAPRAPARRWPACSASTRPPCGSSPRTWAARSGPSSAPTQSTGWSAGSPGSWGGPRAGPRPATRTWSA